MKDSPAVLIDVIYAHELLMLSTSIKLNRDKRLEVLKLVSKRWLQDVPLNFANAGDRNGSRTGSIPELSLSPTTKRAF